jgi:hypothetical protein
MFIARKLLFKPRKVFGLVTSSRNFASEVNRERFRLRKEALGKIPNLKDFMTPHNANSENIPQEGAYEDPFVQPQNILEDQI